MSYLLLSLIVDMMNYEFDRKDLLCLGGCVLVGIWYLIQRVSTPCLLNKFFVRSTSNMHSECCWYEFIVGKHQLPNYLLWIAVAEFF